MIDFESTRPHEVHTDSAARGWRGFRVVRRRAQQPGELTLDPAQPAEASGALPALPAADPQALPAAEDSRDYLVCLNRGLHGTTAFAADGRWHDLSAARSNWVVHPAGLSARYVWSTPADAVHLLLSQQWVDRVAADLCGAPVRRYTLAPGGSNAVPGFWVALEHLCGLVENGPVADSLQAELLAHAFVAHLLARTTDLTAGQRRRIERLPVLSLRRVLERIDAGLGEALSLDTLAGLAGTSPFHFARAFRHTTGWSPHQYVLRRRLDAAHALLRQGRHDVTTVAVACGFSTPSHLACALRRRFGLRPGDVRPAA